MTRTSMKGFPIIFLFSSLSSIFIISNSIDTITTTHFITDKGNETIVSTNERYEMGFFTPGRSKNRYIGIWYKNIPIRTVVWVANRESPLTDDSGVLKVIAPSGILVLINGNNNTIIWSSKASGSVQNPVAQLLDSGNLVVRDAEDSNQEKFIWEGFDYPCDNFLPEMKLGTNLLTGRDRHISSWKSSDDPAPGDCSCHIVPTREAVMRKGSNVPFRSGPWNGIGFNGWPSLKQDAFYTFELVFNSKEVYFSCQLLNSSIIQRFVVNQSGVAQSLIWVDETQYWFTYFSVPNNLCDNYGDCGVYGSCNIANSPRCGCLSKFVPKDPKKWKMADWTSGCVRRTPLNCSGGEGFVKYSNLKFPDLKFSWFNESMGLKECERVCLKNCTCMAYANMDIRNGGSGCLLWFGELIDFVENPENKQDIYIRMASSELDSTVKQVGSKGKKKTTIIVISLVLSIGMVLLGLTFALYIRKKKKKNMQMQREAGRLAQNFEHTYINESHEEDKLPLFDLATIVDATDNFSINNKLGEGGFGPVYKGMLEEGKEIAVKRLAKNSNQGLDEFKNEVIYIAKLQHRNLVKLLGCFIEGEEKMLIYEYLPNKSLDFYIFDEFHSELLDWPKRFNIINGIARGILYLHQDSRLRIIHRDLKASNILLDNEMNPKISDFGMARCFGGNETEAQTNRVVGTYGYMSPEYAVDGIFSVKSDVFSFGVLVLEIVAGKKNRGFFHPEHNHNLLGHAWRLYKEGRQMELIDASIGESSCYISEVLRSIHVALLCVQQCGEDRPNMSSVVLMLGSDGALHHPKQPGFFTERNIPKDDWSSGKQAPSSDYETYITEVEPR